jgi:hypothetical protein
VYALIECMLSRHPEPRCKGFFLWAGRRHLPRFSSIAVIVLRTMPIRRIISDTDTVNSLSCSWIGFDAGFVESQEHCSPAFADAGSVLNLQPLVLYGSGKPPKEAVPVRPVI